MQMLEGSCHCGTVRFSVRSHTPQPYMHCYCSICRKIAGGGGYAINIMGEARTLKAAGRKHLSVYRARIPEGSKNVQSPVRRHFCKRCGSALFISDPRWPKWFYPQASAIDTRLPKPKELARSMLDSRASWVSVPTRRKHRGFTDYPDQSIEAWHRLRGLYET